MPDVVDADAVAWEVRWFEYLDVSDVGCKGHTCPLVGISRGPNEAFVDLRSEQVKNHNNLPIGVCCS